MHSPVLCSVLGMGNLVAGRLDSAAEPGQITFTISVADAEDAVAAQVQAEWESRVASIVLLEQLLMRKRHVEVKAVLLHQCQMMLPHCPVAAGSSAMT